ncbi:MAG: glycosyltransferase family 2 protein [Mediterraneibacter gnavus]
MKAHRITIIIPCFNEEETLPVYYQAMLPVMKQMNPVDFELLFIDDGSSDHTLLEMKQLHQKDPRCKYLSFSRNFGKEAAIYAGLSKASGDYVAVMDVDLQDPPSLLPEMYKILIEEEYDSVATRRSDRTGEPQIRSFLSDSFYKIINRISKTEIMRGARDFRLMKRNMVDAVLEMSEYNRFSKGIFEWVGFRTKWLEYENIERSAGETKWSLKKLFVYSMEGITGFSVAPLSLASVLGLLFCLISFVMIVVIIIRTLIWGDPVSGWPSLTCIIFMVSGVQLLCTGIVGQYLSKTYLETKHRPIFILKDSSEKRTYEEQIYTITGFHSFHFFDSAFLLVILWKIWGVWF